jgi:predicted metal-dependent hydrolase
MSSQIEDVAPLSQAQRDLLKRRLRTQPKTIVEASINVIGVRDRRSSFRRYALKIGTARVSTTEISFARRHKRRSDSPVRPALAGL